MSRLTSIALGGALLAAGVLAGRLMPGAVRAAPAAESTELRGELADVRTALEQMQRSVERARVVAPALVPAAPAQAACPAAEKATDEAARQEQQREQQRNHPIWHDAEALVDDAVARGRWTESDIMRFRELARSAPEIDLVPLMQKIDAAINSRRLRPDPDLLELH